jgi:3-oxoadipate enol-lactonase
VVEIIRKHFLETPVEGYVGCSEAIRKLNYLNKLSRINKPTLIVVGADDPATPVTASQAMHDVISNSRLVVLPNAAHLSNIEQADVFNQVVLDFLLAN